MRQFRDLVRALGPANAGKFCITRFAITRFLLRFCPELRLESLGPGNLPLLNKSIPLRIPRQTGSLFYRYFPPPLLKALNARGRGDAGFRFARGGVTGSPRFSRMESRKALTLLVLSASTRFPLTSLEIVLLALRLCDRFRRPVRRNVEGLED